LSGLKLADVARGDLLRGTDAPCEILNLWTTEPFSANFSFSWVSCLSL